MKKHAYLITAYDNPYVLERLIKMVDHPNNDIFLHLDVKMGNMSEWLNALKVTTVSNITLINRRDVKWGSFNYTESILDLLQSALEKCGNSGGYWYYHLLTGTSLPLKTQQEIHDFFDAEDMDKLFFHINYDIHKMIQNRVKAYYPFIDCSSFRNHKILKGISLILGKAQMLVGIDRTRKSPFFPVYNGWGWFSIPHDFAKYAVSQRAAIRKAFHHTLAADEVWIHTVAMHSPFKARVYGYNGKDDPVDASKHFQDWTRGKPYTFTGEDYELLMNQPNAFWARKFSDSHKDIVDKIYNKIIQEQSGG